MSAESRVRDALAQGEHPDPDDVVVVLYDLDHARDCLRAASRNEALYSGRIDRAWAALNGVRGALKGGGQ